MAQVLEGLLDQSLLNEDFYLKSLSMFMRNSYGIEDRVKANLSVLQNVVNIGDDLFKRLNFWDINYCENNGIALSGTADYWLDLIGNIFGIQREVYCTAGQWGEAGFITLTNKEFLIYIEATSIKNFFDGRNEVLTKYYNQQPSFLQRLGIIYFSNNYGSCELILTNDQECTNSIRRLFVDGYLTAESLGISYTRVISDQFQNAVFATNSSTGAKFYSGGASQIDVFQRR